MRFSLINLCGCFAITILTFACVDPEDLTLVGTVDVIVVDGTINNLAEPQIIRLNRSKADPLTGRFGTMTCYQSYRRNCGGFVQNYSLSRNG